MKFLVMRHALLLASPTSVIQIMPHLTTHSTGARVSLIFIVNLSVFAVRRARLIRALGAFLAINVVSNFFSCLSK